MMDAQEWLDTKYSNKSLTTKIELEKGKKITGCMMIEDFPNLQDINISNLIDSKVELTGFSILNCPNIVVLDYCGTCQIGGSHSFDTEITKIIDVPIIE